MQFEWDSTKAVANLRKHGVDFNEAITVFGDSLTRTFLDPNDSEERFLTFGISADNRLLVVVHTNRSDKIRIISARKQTPKERRDYGQLRQQ